MNKKHESSSSDKPSDSSHHHPHINAGHSLSSSFINSIINNSSSNKDQGKNALAQSVSSTSDKESIRHGALKWNITNSAQNIVSALVDPSKHYDYAFRREWSNTFSSGPTGIPSGRLLKPSARTKKDAELKSKLQNYLYKLEERRIIKQREHSHEASHNEQVQCEQKPTAINIKRVPDIFMQEHLELSDLETFRNISNLFQDESNELSEQTKHQTDSITYHKYAFNKFQLRQLQKKLTDYLDIIEESLAEQISNRSGDFFQVMSSVDSVMDEISLAIKSVTSLRKKCATLNNALILPNLRNIQLTKSRNNASEVLARLNTIATLCKVQSKIQLLLSSSDFVGALSLIAKSRSLLENELVGIVCLRHLESQLNEIERVIGKMMQQEFVTLITSEWNRPVGPTPDGHKIDLDNSDNPDTKLFEHERVLSIVQGMIRINRLNFGEYFQQEARYAISTCVKQTLIEFLSDEDDCIGNDDKVSQDVYKTVQLISYTKWVAMIKIVFTNLLSILRRIKIVYKVILSSLDQVDSFLSDGTLQTNGSLSDPCHIDPTSTTAKIPGVFQMLDPEVKRKTLTDVRQGKSGLQSSFQAVCDFGNEVTSNLIEYRIKESNFDKFLATEFINLSKLIEDFTRGFSDICDRNQVTLRKLLQTQADKFVKKFHDERKNRIKSNLDIEQWKMVEEIPQDFQQLITYIIDDKIPMWQCLEAVITKEYQQHTGPIKNQGISRDGERIANSKSLTDAIDDVKASSCNKVSKLEQTVISTKQKKPGRSYIMANKQNYVIVNSAINLIRMMIDYCRCANDIKFLSSELLDKLLELIRLYNSTTYQLVYRAKAREVAGLKTITARNLVVSQRSIKLILIVLPSIRQHFDRLLSEDKRSMLKGFDEISLKYMDHASKIPEKVVYIVRGLINTELQEWEAKPPVPSQQFCAVWQHLMRLHDNIEDAIPFDELRGLFLKIHITFKEVLRSHLKRLKIANVFGPQQWLVKQELAFYEMNSGKMRVFESVNLNFDDLWSNLDTA